jgi:hypothetical protein
MEMNNTPPPNDSRSDDDAFAAAPLQFAADRMGKLVHIAEHDPSRQVVVPADTMHKLYVAYLGALEVYQAQTAAGVLINGERFTCSTELQKAITPLIQESLRIQAEKDVDREIELIKAAAQVRQQSEIANSNSDDWSEHPPSKLH